MMRSKGFSLLEILVAFTVLALSLSILLKIFSTGVNTAFVAEEYTAAVQIAESLMVTTGVEKELQIGESTGINDEKYHWRTQINVINNPVNGEDDLAIEFLHINVAVRWDDASKQSRLLELNSIFTRHKQP